MQRNEAFFRAHERWFIQVKERYGEADALACMRSVMEYNLGNAYGDGFAKGNPQDFARVVGERDASVGLTVKFPVISDNKIVYQFHTDPFPELRGHVSAENLDATYMKLKVHHLMGDGWSYTTTKHIWHGDDCTEHVIEKISA